LLSCFELNFERYFPPKLPKWKALQVEPTALAFVHLLYLNDTQKDLPSHLCRQPQSVVKFHTNPGPTSRNRPARNWRWENTVHILIKFSVSMPLNQHLKLSTREFHTPPHFNLGKTTVGAHSHE